MQFVFIQVQKKRSIFIIIVNACNLENIKLKFLELKNAIIIHWNILLKYAEIVSIRTLSDPPLGVIYSSQVPLLLQCSRSCYCRSSTYALSKIWYYFASWKHYRISLVAYRLSDPNTKRDICLNIFNNWSHSRKKLMHIVLFSPLKHI